MIAPRKVINEKKNDNTPTDGTPILDILCSEELAQAEEFLVEQGILQPVEGE